MKVLVEAKRRWWQAKLVIVITMFPVIIETCGGACLHSRGPPPPPPPKPFNLLGYFVQIDKFLLNCIYYINVRVVEFVLLLYLGITRKKKFILSFVFTVFQVQQIKTNIQNLI